MAWRRKINNLALNLFLVFVSLLSLFLILEFIVFRYILIASDFPKVESVHQVLKYKPNQKGIWRLKNEAISRYAINANGWNSGHEAYQTIKNKKRIAIIGDSYIEAFSVNYNRSVAELLERYLGINQFEVYRFGIGGAHMAQYLHLLRKEVVNYRPDLVIINLAHNDFDESYSPVRNLYERYFLKLVINNGKVEREIYPISYKPKWFTPISYSATWRYLHIRQKVSFQPLKDLILGKGRGIYQANINISNIEEENRNNRIAADYIFRRIKEICTTHQIKLLIVIDGDRGRIYKQSDDLFDYASGALTLNKIARDISKKFAIDFIDLHPVFDREFKKSKKIFDYPSDGHWNQLAHQIVARCIYKYLMEHKQLLN